MIALHVQMIDRSGLKGGARRIGQVQRLALRDTAETWHAQLLAKHFSPGAAAGYRFAARSRVYKEFIKPHEGTGQGKFVDLLLKGRARRSLQSLYSIVGSKDRATIRMQAPAYFTNPFVGTFTDPKTGKLKRITRQPDKVREVTAVGAGDRQILRDRFADRLLVRWQAAQAAAAPVVTSSTP